MAINKLVCTWSGLPGGPGYSIFYTNTQSPSIIPFSSFFAAIQAFYPQTVTVTVPNNGEVLDELTGKMTNVWTSGTQTATPGTGATTYPPQAGAQVKWGTNGFRNGRRVWGRTFLVPLTAAQFGAGGVLLSTTCNSIQAAAATMISQLSPALVVWSRPVYKKPPVEGDPPILSRQGAITVVTTATCPTKSATLRGRRDV